MCFNLMFVLISLKAEIERAMRAMRIPFKYHAQFLAREITNDQNP